MTARPAAPDGAGEVKSMDTSLGNRKLPRCCAPEPGNGDWTGADDSDPAGRKTVALPLPHAATPVRMPAASNAAAPRRPRMLPPWPPGLGDRTRVRPRRIATGGMPGPALIQIHPMSTERYLPLAARALTQMPDYSWPFPRLVLTLGP